MSTTAPLWKHLLIVGAVALGLYALGFTWIEHRRVRQGPWKVTFTNTSPDGPRLRIDQAALGITNVQIEFHTVHVEQPVEECVRFLPGQPVPFDVPFGRCVFMDPLFLPGTVALQLFGHDVELLPRVLIIDKDEYAWVSGQLIRVGRPARVDAPTNTIEQGRADLDESRK